MTLRSHGLLCGVLADLRWGQRWCAKGVTLTR
jgi:hypothetical protein